MHDEVAAVVTGLSDGELTGHSGASEWSLTQVLSHLGSGEEISLATLRQRWPRRLDLARTSRRTPGTVGMR